MRPARAAKRPGLRRARAAAANRCRARRHSRRVPALSPVENARTYFLERDSAAFRALLAKVWPLKSAGTTARRPGAWAAGSRLAPRRPSGEAAGSSGSSAPAPCCCSFDPGALYRCPPGLKAGRGGDD